MFVGGGSDGTVALMMDSEILDFRRSVERPPSS
jgi:hypothetical protein